MREWGFRQINKVAQCHLVVGVVPHRPRPPAPFQVKDRWAGNSLPLCWGEPHRASCLAELPVFPSLVSAVLSRPVVSHFLRPHGL